MAKGKTASSNIVATKKKTSIGGNHAMMKMSSMNKSRKSNYKRYRGQGT